MSAYELIRKKRDGGELSAEEIAWLVEGFVGGGVPDYQMAAFLMAVYFRGMSPAETAALTQSMVRSGETLDLEPLDGRAVDKHSSGGVGDKTSIVLVPLVASAGVPVPKLSGRGLGHTGGTLDKLEAIPGLRTGLSVQEFKDQVVRIGCAIAGQSPALVPADAQLYALRDVTATVDSVPLIASSIMSKKLAVKSSALLLDVKCGRGAFMKTEASARILAEAMVGIGEASGRRTVAVISGMDHPLGRAVGNALEVAEAIATLRGDGPRDLEALCLALGGWMLALGGRAASPEEGAQELHRRLHNGDALAKFEEMVRAQGGDARVVDDPGRLPAAPCRITVPAPARGIVADIDAEAIGLACMQLGAGRARKDESVDPAVGVVIERSVGDAVEMGDCMATVHARSEAAGLAATCRVAAAFTLAEGAPEAAPVIRGVIKR